MKIIHVLAVGSVKDDLTGYRIKPDTAGEFYETVKKIVRRKTNETEKSSSRRRTG